MNRTFWRGKPVFVTGHTGFKGGWLSSWLVEMGARVTGYALPPDTEPSFFALCQLDRRVHSIIADIRDAAALKRAVRESRPEIIFHLAAQPLVRRSYREPALTFETNIMGTVHLLEAAQSAPSARAILIVTSDKCYEDREWVWGYRERDRLGGRDPYSASKGCAELVAAAYRRSFFESADPPVGVATVRAGNVIGGGDWAEDRLVPDAVRALHSNRALIVRNPQATRPWQHVLEPLAGYLELAERLFSAGLEYAGAWNFGPATETSVTVTALANRIFEQWGTGVWKPASADSQPHESGSLTLDSSKAGHLLGWRPLFSLDEAVKLTVDWYRRALSAGSANMSELVQDQIVRYEKLLGNS